MEEILQVLRTLVEACEDVFEDMKQQGLDLDGYWNDMDTARKAVARAHKLFEHRELQKKVRAAFVAASLDLGADYHDQLTSGDHARLRAAMDACCNNNGYDSASVDKLIQEFKERYHD